jgi:hypothetical protein
MDCIPSKKHICNICNKEYSSRQNLWKHSKKFHNNDNKNSNLYVKNMSNKLDDKTDNCQINVKKVSKSLICNICEDVFNSRQAKWAHEKKCNINKGNCEVDDLKEQLKQKDKQLEEFKIQILDLIKKSCKIHPKTLQKINNTLNNNSNNTVNNTYIVQFGREKLYEVFTKKEQIDVLNCGNLCLENLIEKAHFNAKYPQFKNILITNLQNNLAYKYNAETNNFDVLTKKELLEDIISERMFDIEEFFNNYKDDITPKMQMVIENFIKKMDTESYEDIKKQNIKIILYNNRSLVDKANIII